MSTRVITMFSTKGGKNKVELGPNKTWDDLKPLVEEKYDLSNLQATENKNKTTLTHPDAVLPEGDFVLFLRPIKTKSGADMNDLGFRELRALVNNDSVKEYLNEVVPDKNWTQLTTDELRAGLNSYFVTAPEEVQEEVHEEKQEEEVKKDEDTFSFEKELFQKLSEVSDTLSNVRIIALGLLAGKLGSLVDEEDEEPKKKVEESEDEKLQRELDELEAGLED